jgi:hypothetical protein
MPTLPPTPPPAARRPSLVRVAAYAALLVGLGLVAWRGTVWLGVPAGVGPTSTAATLPDDASRLLNQVRDEVNDWPKLWNDAVFSSLQAFPGLSESTPGNLKPFESRRPSTTAGGRGGQ